MSRAAQWKKILGYTKKPTVQVRVGERLEHLTDTQAYRFEDLTQRKAENQAGASDNPFEQSRYSLDEAAFRLMTSGESILQTAAAGSIDLFAGVAGLTGRWRHQADKRSAMDSPEFTLRSGYLALTTSACEELAVQSGTRVSTFRFPELPDPSATGLDDETLGVLSTWRDNETWFLAREPHWVDRDSIVLLAPLVSA